MALSAKKKLGKGRKNVNELQNGKKRKFLLTTWWLEENYICYIPSKIKSVSDELFNCTSPDYVNSEIFIKQKTSPDSFKKSKLFRSLLHGKICNKHVK